ncbi:MAG TPA: hypothetical protein VM782_01100 [Stellaceae bacterium]|nr:hypothetical protein [Stellaceae bacterium]
MSGFPQLGAYVRVYTTLTPSGDTTGATDTAAIQAALTAATPTAGTVVLAPGTYYLNAPIVIGPLGTATPAMPVRAPSLITTSSAGHIGDNSFPTDVSAVEITCASSFPVGKYMIDYQMGTAAGSGGPSGAVVSGFSLNCAGKGAGLRLQGIRRFDVANISINGGASPAGYTDGSAGGLEINNATNSTAGAWSTFRNITVYNCAANGIHHNAANQDTFIGCNVMNNGLANYFLDSLCQATFFGCSSQGTTNLWGWECLGASATIIGGSTEAGGAQQYAVYLRGNAASAGVNTETYFIGTQFVGLGSGGAQPLVFGAFTPGRQHLVKFMGCEFDAAASTSYWVQVAASCTGYIDFDNCIFNGVPATGSYLDSSGNNILRFNRCRGINPVGVVTPAVPASGSAVAGQPYDRTFYVSTVVGTTTCSMAIQGGPTITFVGAAAQVVAVRVPAGQTATPTYTGAAPTWVVEGE